MATYFVDDGGSNTSPFDTWAKAATSLSALDDAVAFASGDIVYIGHNHACQYTHSENRIITGPSNGYVSILSATQGSDPPAYQASATNQIDTSEGAYSLNFSGLFAMFGIRMKSGANIIMTGSDGGKIKTSNCTIAPAAGASIESGFNYSTWHSVEDTFDLTADGSTNRTASIFSLGYAGATIYYPTFVNPGYRTGNIIAAFGAASVQSVLVGADLSGFSSSCAIIGGQGNVLVSNCITPASFTPFVIGTMYAGTVFALNNTGPSDMPSSLYLVDCYGYVESTISVYRSNGAKVEGDSFSWLIKTKSLCTENVPFYTPWIYGTVGSTGSKTFTCHITNDTDDFDDSMVWLELEYLKDANSGQWTLATDQRATITTPPVAQTDDTTSEWNEISGSGTYSQTGTTMTVTDTAHGLIVGNAIVLDCTSGDGNDGTYTIVTVPTADTFTITSSTSETVSGNCTWQMAPVYTYKQSLDVTATIGETGQYRARVAVGVASIAASRYFYLDPKITVS